MKVSILMMNAQRYTYPHCTLSFQYGLDFLLFKKRHLLELTKRCSLLFECTLLYLKNLNLLNLSLFEPYEVCFTKLIPFFSTNDDYNP